MSLVNTLMNGGFTGVSVNASKYTHDGGALRIATESVEELHDIFLEFYDMEQAELAAVHEGVALEGSQYQAVYEGAIGNAITSIKNFFKKLWEKVKAFFKNVRMYLDAAFMKAKDFAKKYKKVIQEANKDLKDFEYKMFKYNNSAIDSADLANDFNTDFAIKDTENLAKTVRTALETNSNVQADPNASDKEKTDAITKRTDDLSKLEADTKDLTDEDKMATQFATEHNLKGVKAREDLAEAMYALYRNGATSAEDKDDEEVKDLMTYVSVLEESKTSKIDKYGRKIDDAYKKMIKDIDDIEKEISKASQTSGGTASKAAAVLRNVSKGFSLYQSFQNSLVDAWKTAAVERDNTYKSLLLAGIANGRKNKKK